MARIAGVNLPTQKRLEIGLTYIYGIGRSTAQKIITTLELDPNQKVRDLTDEEVTKLRTYIDSELEVEGDLRRERAQAIKRLTEIGATAGSAIAAASPCDGQRTKTNARTRKGPKKTVGRGKKAPKIDGASSQVSGPRPHASPGQEEHRHRAGAHQDVVQQHDRHAHRPRGERHRVGVRRLGRLQGLAQVDALRRAGDRRQRRPQGHGARPAEGRGLRQGPGLGARDGDPLAPGRRPRDPRRQGTSPRRRTTASGSASGGGSSGSRSRPRSAASAAARGSSSS